MSVNMVAPLSTHHGSYSAGRTSGASVADGARLTPLLQEGEGFH